jgi:uncharacterized protein (TIGR03083 family)
MPTTPLEPVYTAALFEPLLAELLSLLRGLRPDDWNRPTVAGAWTVREVAAHLLDGDLRKLSAHRDGAVPATDGPEPAYDELVEYINALNRDGVRLFGRTSTRVLTDLLEATGRWVADFVATLDPHATAVYAVAWAGESRSENWMDTGREYTERWHHQMQIRDAIGAPGLLGPEWLLPLLRLSVRAVPRALERTAAPDGASIVLRVTGVGGGSWSVHRRDAAWHVVEGEVDASDAVVETDADASWRLFFNALTPEQAAARVAIHGDVALARAVLATRAVMVRSLVTETGGSS